MRESRGLFTSWYSVTPQKAATTRWQGDYEEGLDGGELRGI